MNDLGLSPNTFVDSYNPHSSTWEQQTITTVRLIESEQRLLFRIRKSLLDGLSDNDCPGTDHEIGLQSRFTRSPSAPVVLPVNSLKRPADPSDSYGPPTKYYRHDEYSAQRTYAASPPAQENGVYPQSISVAKSQPPNDMPVPTYPHHSPLTQNSHPPANIQPPHTHAPPNNSHQYPTPSPGLSTPSTSQSSSSEPAIPYHPHPPLKRWPNDYTVSEIAAGFRQMDAMISAQPTLTQKSTFQKVFGCRYIKSTVCRHRAVWKRADPSLKDTYEKMGTDERAVWGEFVKKAEGKIPSAATTSGGAGVGGSMNGNGHRSQTNVDTSQSNGHTTSHSHLAPQPGQMMSSMQAPVPPPTSVTMGMLTHGIPSHVGLGPDPDKSEGPPVMASLVPPPSHVAGGSMHSGRSLFDLLKIEHM